MISRILSIENFGVFNDFKWNRDSKLQDFKEKNIIYGWNYSGKTTLSRIFCSLRDKAIHFDYPNAKFKIKFDSGAELEISDIGRFSTPVYVFNQEYVESKLTWNSRSDLSDPIAFDVGDNVNIRKEIEILDEIIELATKRKQLHSIPIEIFNEFEKRKFTAESRTIRAIVSNNTIHFDKGHFKNILKSITPENLNDLIITDENDVKALQLVANSTNDFLELDKYDAKFPIVDYYNRTIELLKEEPPKDILISILEGNKELYNWVKKGLTFKENINSCSFCGSPIPDTRFDELNQYFSNASKWLRSEIEALRSQIKTEIDRIASLVIPQSKNDFTEKLRQRITGQLKSFEKIKKDYLKELKHILKELDRKEEGNIFNHLSYSDSGYKVSAIYEWFNEVNKIILEHNSAITNFEAERDKARNILKRHLVADFLKKESYFVRKSSRDRAIRWQGTYEKFITHKQRIKQTKVDSLKTITKGKEELNKFIQKFLNRDDIRIEVTQGNRFILLRKGQPARNLSEGEKTAIAFSYFLVEFESLGIKDMQRAIIFIDDPISSLDTNHIAQVYTLINSFFFRKNIDLDNPDKVVNCFKQLFLSTHSFEFFSFLRDSTQLKKKKKTRDHNGKKIEIPNCGYYQIQKLDHDTSTLKTLHKALKNYKSEYVYLFSLIYEYKKQIDTGGDTYNILIPNAFRRFLEIYTLMKIPSESDSVENRIIELVDDINNYKTLNHFSHFTTFEKTTRHDELIMALPQACSELFNLLALDSKHFSSLKKAIGA